MAGLRPGLYSFCDEGGIGQEAFAAAVVMPSLLRPSVLTALRSVFRQDVAGRVQVLIGVDRDDGSAEAGLAAIGQACGMRPAGWAVQVLWPGYSTSERHGGLGRARDGGVLRSVLTQLSNARHVAYLDDDNWWGPTHLSSLLRAVEGRDWAFSRRWFVHPGTLRPVAVDEWESVGEGGVFAERFGGFVDPNCLMIDRTRCDEAVACWNRPLDGDVTQMTADRRVYAQLRMQPGRGTGEATAFYVAGVGDALQPMRARLMGEAWERAGVLG